MIYKDDTNFKYRLFICTANSFKLIPVHLYPKQTPDYAKVTIAVIHVAFCPGRTEKNDYP
jgi:hypothetical protein